MTFQSVSNVVNYIIDINLRDMTKRSLNLYQDNTTQDFLFRKENCVEMEKLRDNIFTSQRFNELIIWIVFTVRCTNWNFFDFYSKYEMPRSKEGDEQYGKAQKAS